MGLYLVQIDFEGLLMAGLFLCPEGGGQHTKAKKIQTDTIYDHRFSL